MLIGAWLCAQLGAAEAGGASTGREMRVNGGAREAATAASLSGGPAVADEGDEWRWRDTERWGKMVNLAQRGPDDNIATAWFGTTAVGYVDDMSPPGRLVSRPTPHKAI